jgi:hypothetical protein
VDRRIGASYIPNVAAIINSMSCKRNFSSKSKEKQQEKIEIEKKISSKWIGDIQNTGKILALFDIS